MLIGISLISFFIMHLAPGDITSTEASFNPKASEESIQRLRETYNLDKPVMVQYGLWLKRIVQLDTPCVIKSPRFHAFTKPDNGGGRNAKWTTEFLKDNFKAKAGAPVKKIYISRNADAEARGVDNEEQVKDFLRPLGFQFYDKFSALTLQEKVDLLHSCEVVISATGANLTHVYAMQPRTTVIDFNHKFLLETEYWYNNVGDTAGLNWVTCGMPTGSPAKRPKLKNINLIVSIEILEQAISLCNLK